jgi:predicted enzyme related to lactoylglutathione lyase
MAVAKQQTSARTSGDEIGFSLSECRAVATLPATDIERARRFYAEKLGLTANPGAAPGNYLYQCGGATFALYETPGKASGTHNQMAFSVSDLDTVVRQLKARGVVFTGDIAEDERTRTAWFKDSEGNLLMVREILACPVPSADALNSAGAPMTSGSPEA